MWVVVAAFAGLLAGEVMRRRLNRLGYRLGAERAQEYGPLLTDHRRAGVSGRTAVSPGASETGGAAVNPGAVGTATDPGNDEAGEPDPPGTATDPGPAATSPDHDSDSAVGVLLDMLDSDSPPADDTDPRGKTPVPLDLELPETDFPAPGPRYWVPLLLALAWGGTVWALLAFPAAGFWPRLVGWLAFGLIGVWLATIDLDVYRLPDSGQFLLAGVLLICGLAWAWPHWDRMLEALGIGVGCGLLFWLMHLVRPADMGLGDVKLVAVCGWWLGLISLSAVLAGLFLACVMGLAFGLAARQHQFAFGPWLVAGTLIAGLAM